jgi:hypothetical protein
MADYTPQQAEEDTLSMLKVWVWSGFHSEADAAGMLEDHLSEEAAFINPEAIRKALASEFKTKLAVEKSWPQETDCDRLDRVFETLNAQGICALQNAGYTQSDGFSDVSEVIAEEGRENFRGYCFYHGQDLERAIAGHGLLLAFGDLEQSEAQSIAIARSIIEALTKERFTTKWDGTTKQRIDIRNIDWKRRTPR